MKGKCNQNFSCKIHKSGSLKLSNIGIGAPSSYVKPNHPENSKFKQRSIGSIKVVLNKQRYLGIENNIDDYSYKPPYHLPS